MLKDVKSILLVRLSSSGDVILTTPVAARLKAVCPGARITALTRAAFAGVFQKNPHVEETAVFEDRGLLGWAAEIRRRKFDLFVDLHDTPRSRLWGLLSGSSHRVRYDKRAAARRLLVWTKRSSPALSPDVVDRYLACLAPLGVSPGADVPRLYTAGEAPPLELSSRLGAGAWIGLAPGALHGTKRWPPERFARAADLWVDALSKKTGQPHRVMILGAAADKPAAREVLARLGSVGVSFVGETNLRGFFLLIKRCALFLTNDSGAMHAAAALDVPLVAVFGPTVKAFGFFPRGEKSVVMENDGLYCRPCSLHGADRCPEGHFRCMKDISPESVAQAGLGLLEKARP